MERKKKRDKPAANGSAAEGTSGQSGDAHGWQREVEQQGSAKRLASSTTSDSPMQNCVPPSFNWSFAQHPSTSGQQQPTHALMPQQPHVQAVPQQQVAALQGPPQGGPQTLPPVSQLGWQNPEAFAQSAAPTHPPFQPGVGESSWPHAAAAAGAQSLSGRPPPFPFPPPPYSGPWDPVSWWGHNPYPPPFPYLYPGYGSGYPCPMPPTPPIGAANQRGLIKPPPGLSQKHIRIWEAQSMENMQLWTTTTQLWAAVARSDAEIALQRTKILKLEADLQIIKAHRDGNMPQSEVASALQSGSKRGRRKKATPAPVATAVSLPASDSNALRAPGRKARASTNKVDPAAKVKEMELEEKEKSTLGNHVPELVYRPTTEDRDQKSCSLTVGSLRNESPSQQKHPLRQTLEFQSSTNNSHNMAKDDLAFGHINHLGSPYKPSSLIAARKDGNFEHSLRESVAVSFLKNASNLDHQGVITGDMSFGAAINSAGLCPDINGNVMAKDAVVRSQLQAHFNVHNIDKSIPLNLRKPWQYTGEDGSDEQDDGGASVQDDDDGDEGDDEDDENTLDDMHSDKVSNLWHSIPFR